MTEFTILFADIAGSTALYENLGDTQAENLINKVLKALSDIVDNHAGQVIKTNGDEILCQFSSSSQAIQAARRMHEYTAMQSQSELNHKVSIRVGAHVGTVIHAQGDIYGDTVNVASRVVSLARGGKTLISEQTYNTLPDNLQQLCRNMKKTHLKGKEQPVNIYDVVWEHNDQLTRIAQVSQVQDTRKKFILSYHEQQITLTQGSLKIGRGTECNLIVEAPQASRLHCEIRQVGHKFSLTDSSTNGTYVQQNNVELLFHNETVPLHQSGILSLGQQSKGNNEHLIHFTIESEKL